MKQNGYIRGGCSFLSLLFVIVQIEINALQCSKINLNKRAKLHLFHLHRYYAEYCATAVLHGNHRNDFDEIILLAE